MAKNKKTTQNSLSEVTSVSKMLAAILFVILPIIGFLLGVKYGVEVSLLY